MRKQEPAEQDVRRWDRKRSTNNIVNLEFQFRTVVASCICHVAFRSIESNRAAGIHDVLKKASGPARTATKVDCDPRCTHAAVLKQFSRFGFIQFGKSPEPRARLIAVSKCVFASG